MNRAASYPRGDIVPSTRWLSLRCAHTHQQFAGPKPDLALPRRDAASHGCFPCGCQASWPWGHCPGPPASHSPTSLPQTALGSKETPQSLSPRRGPAGLGEPAEQEPRAARGRSPMPCHHCSPGVWCVAVLCLCSGAAPAPRCASCRWGWAGDTRTMSATAQQPSRHPTPPNPTSGQTCETPQNWGPSPHPSSSTAESGVTTGLGSPQLQEPQIPASQL